MTETVHKPIRTLRFRLGRVDFLSYEMLPREMTWRMKFAMLAIVGCSGLAVGLLPEGMSTAAWLVATAAILVLAGISAVISTNLVIRCRAAGHVVPDGEVVIEEWGDHLVETVNGKSRYIAYETIAQVIVTQQRLFIRAGSAPLVIPAAAFETENDMRAFGAVVDETSKCSQP